MKALGSSTIWLVAIAVGILVTPPLEKVFQKCSGEMEVCNCTPQKQDPVVTQKDRSLRLTNECAHEDSGEITGRNSFTSGGLTGNIQKDGSLILAAGRCGSGGNQLLSIAGISLIRTRSLATPFTPDWLA